MSFYENTRCTSNTRWQGLIWSLDLALETPADYIVTRDEGV
jgi:hypothetical protein